MPLQFIKKLPPPYKYTYNVNSGKSSMITAKRQLPTKQAPRNLPVSFNIKLHCRYFAPNEAVVVGYRHLITYPIKRYIAAIIILVKIFATKKGLSTAFFWLLSLRLHRIKGYSTTRVVMNETKNAMKISPESTLRISRPNLG